MFIHDAAEREISRLNTMPDFRSGFLSKAGLLPRSILLFA